MADPRYVCCYLQLLSCPTHCSASPSVQEATFILIHSEIESNTPRLVESYDAIMGGLK